jgi:FKBP-type peptidyl-prolyl cis-trans isomerase 2
MVVPKTKIPAELLTVGAKLLGHAGRQVVPGRVEEIREDAVVVDTNHPLAGKTITVEIVVMNIILPAQKPPLPVS